MPWGRENILVKPQLLLYKHYSWWDICEVKIPVVVYLLCECKVLLLLLTAKTLTEESSDGVQYGIV